MRFLGILLALILVLVGIGWLRVEIPKLLTPEIKNTFNFSSSSYSYGVHDSVLPGSTTISPGAPAPHVFITSVALGEPRALLLDNNGTLAASLDGWTLTGGNGTVTLGSGVRKLGPTQLSPVSLDPGQTLVLFDGTANYSNITRYPDAVWFAWLGKTFMKDHDTLILKDQSGAEMNRLNY